MSIILTCLQVTRNINRNSYLILWTVGLNPKIPHMWAGILMLPPISPPTPIRDPPPAIRAASPPEEPPTPRPGLCGFVVAPKMGLDVSQLIMVCGTFVFTKGTAPCCFNTCFVVLIFTVRIRRMGKVMFSQVSVHSHQEGPGTVRCLCSQVLSWGVP